MVIWLSCIFLHYIILLLLHKHQTPWPFWQGVLYITLCEVIFSKPWCNSRPIKTLATRISTITWAIILKVACVFLFFSMTDEAQLSSPEGPPTKVRLRHLHISNNDAYMCTFCVLSFSYITSWWAMFDLTIIKIQIKGVVLLLHAWQMIDWFSFLFIFLFLGELKLLMRSLKQ